MRQLVVSSRTPGGDLAATYGDVILLSYVSPVCEEALERALVLVERSLARAPHGILTQIQPDVRAPSDELKARLADVMTAHAPAVLGACTVVLGTGFLGSCMRSGLARVRLRAGRCYERGVFDTLPEAAAWLAARVPDLDARELYRVARSLAPALAERREAVR